MNDTIPPIDIERPEALYGYLRKCFGSEMGTGFRQVGRERFRKWVLRKGMEFGSPCIWWGDTSKSRKEAYGGGDHEGIDFAVGQTPDGQIEADTQGIQVPLFVEGQVHWCFKDLVGDTVLVFSGGEIHAHRFFIQYSHIVFDSAFLGQSVRPGTIIGSIKRSDNPKSITASHLHISAGLLKSHLLDTAREAIEFAHWLEWDLKKELLFLDPLQIIHAEDRKAVFLTDTQARPPLGVIVTTGATKDDRLMLRRQMARAFPGIRVVAKETDAEASEMARACEQEGAVAIRLEDGKWKILEQARLTASCELPLEGDGMETAIQALRLPFGVSL